MQDSQHAYADSDAQTTTVTHRYNLLGQRIATDVGADGKPATPLAQYQYNADGSLAETALGPDGLPRKYRYDPLGELTQIADPAMTETLSYKLPGDQGYGDGNITQATYDLHYTDGVSHTYAYSYDPHDRLMAAHNDQAKLAGSSLEAVTYDPNGNIKTQRRGDGQTHMYTLAPKTNQVATVTSDGTNAHYAYDAKGRLNSASREGAPDVSSLDYDPLNNLPRHVSGSDDLEVDYHYDVHNRRVAKVSRNGGADTSRIYYRGQGATALTELAGDATGPEPQTYLRGPGGLHAVEIKGQRYFVSRDHLGSTRALTDATGKVTAYFNYTPFGDLMPGNSQDSDGLAADIAYRFAGTEYDAETGLYNNRARWYDPALGRFLTPDPAHQYPSPYVYVGNNPVNGVDPTGMFNPLAEAGVGAEVDDAEMLTGLAPGGDEAENPNVARLRKDKEKEKLQEDYSSSASDDSSDAVIHDVSEESDSESFDEFSDPELPEHMQQLKRLSTEEPKVFRALSYLLDFRENEHIKYRGTIGARTIGHARIQITYTEAPELSRGLVKHALFLSRQMVKTGFGSQRSFDEGHAPLVNFELSIINFLEDNMKFTDINFIIGRNRLTADRMILFIGKGIGDLFDDKWNKPVDSFTRAQDRARRLEVARHKALLVLVERAGYLMERWFVHGE